MSGDAIPPWIVPVAVAVGTVIVVPALVALGKYGWNVWREWRLARLSKVFITREEVEVQFATLHQTQQAQHAQNHALLDTIRSEGQAREGKLLGTMEAVRAEGRQDARDLRTEVGVVSARVDNVLHMLGDRRRT